MTLPWALPDWLPWWAVTLAAVPVLGYVLLLALMPFGVFGVKDRLAEIEARLDDIQRDLRYFAAVAAGAPEEAPPSAEPAAPDRPKPGRGARAEPRLHWPR